LLIFNGAVSSVSVRNKIKNAPQLALPKARKSRLIYKKLKIKKQKEDN